MSCTNLSRLPPIHKSFWEILKFVLLLYFIIQCFVNCSIDRFVHDAPLKLHKAATVLHKFRNLLNLEKQNEKS